MFELQSEFFVDADFTFRIAPGRKMFSTSEFIQSLKQWALAFNQKLTQTGLNPLYFGRNAQQQPVVAPIALFGANGLPLGGAGNQLLQYLNFNTTNDGSIEIVGSQNFWNDFCVSLHHMMD